MTKPDDDWSDYARRAHRTDVWWRCLAFMLGFVSGALVFGLSLAYIIALGCKR